jgi:hypothetical protein
MGVKVPGGRGNTLEIRLLQPNGSPIAWGNQHELFHNASGDFSRDEKAIELPFYQSIARFALAT